MHVSNSFNEAQADSKVRIVVRVAVFRLRNFTPIYRIVREKYGRFQSLLIYNLWYYSADDELITTMDALVVGVLAKQHPLLPVCK